MSVKLVVSNEKPTSGVLRQFKCHSCGAEYKWAGPSYVTFHRCPSCHLAQFDLKDQIVTES